MRAPIHVKSRSPKILAIALGSLLLATTTSTAAVINGGFEMGGLSGWTLIGQGHVETASVGVTPTEGTYQGYLETTGNYTALAPAVAASLGLSGPAIFALGAGPPTNGTGISQVVTVTAGDTVSFDWNFMTDELNEEATYNDFAFYSIDGSAFLLASRNSSTFDTVSPPAGFDGQTGWGSESYTFSTGGAHTIGFGVLNVGDSGHNSVLLIDAVSIPVPETSTLAMCILAFGMFFCGSAGRCFKTLIINSEQRPV